MVFVTVLVGRCRFFHLFYRRRTLFMLICTETKFVFTKVSLIDQFLRCTKLCIDAILL